MDKAQVYADIIIEDDLNRIVSEETLTYEEDFIERQYEFEDGAVVKYEWRGFPGSSAEEKFNHRFTLVALPEPNPDNVKKGPIKTIKFAR